MNSIYGFKQDQSQDHDSNGMRVPLTWVKVEPATILTTKTIEKNKYSAIQIALGHKKTTSKPLQGILNKLPQNTKSPDKNQEKPARNASHSDAGGISPLFIRELKLDKSDELDKFAVGQKLLAADVLTVGDKINVTGISKGKGFAGVMKRHGFHGGPKTHGQSNRPRHAGSIGATTTPGRVYKGKKMAGHMGVNQKTIRNLEIFKVVPEKNLVLIRGLVPGNNGGLIKITKV